MVRLRPPSTVSLCKKGLILNSYAKLNLYLEVLNIRKDSYHNINTLFERIGLLDKIILKPRPDKLIKVACKDRRVPRGNSNLCYRSAKLLQESFKVNSGVGITIIKRIPVGAGLGGGSSNAATVLLGLNELWNLRLSQGALVKFAQKIGCDAPFFIYNTPFAKGLGRGDRIRPLRELNHLRLWHIIVVPPIKVLTALIYKEWDVYAKNKKAALTPHLFSIQKMPKYLNKLKGAGLTKPRDDVNILILRLRKKALSLIAGSLFNGLEEVTRGLYPEVRRIKEKLVKLGLKAVLMSGSGPAVMAIVSSRKEAVALGRRIKRQHRPWQVFAARTI